MANDHIFGTVPATDLLPGRGLRSASVAKLGGVLNWHLAHLTSKVKVLHKGLPDAFAAGIASVPAATAATSMIAADVRIPRVSTAHTLLHCRARVTVAGAGNGRIDFITRGGPDTLTLSSAAAGPVDLEGTVDFDTGAAYDDLGIEVQTQAGTTMVVHSIEVWVEPLADPIPAGTSISGAQAFGLTSLGPDYPHDAGLNDAFLDALGVIRSAPRVLFCDVAISTTFGGDGQLLDRVHQGWVTLPGGNLRAELSLTVWVDGVRPAAPADAWVYVQSGRPGFWPTQGAAILFDADGWKEGSLSPLAEHVSEPLSVPSTFLGVWPAGADGEAHGRSTAEIRSITVWGV